MPEQLKPTPIMFSSPPHTENKKKSTPINDYRCYTSIEIPTTKL